MLTTLVVLVTALWFVNPTHGARRRRGAQPEQADTVARELGGLALPADVLRREDLVAALGRLLDEAGRVDILVNAAGGNWAGTTLGEGAPVLDVPEDGVPRGGRPESRRDAAAVPGVWRGDDERRERELLLDGRRPGDHPGRGLCSGEGRELRHQHDCPGGFSAFSGV